MHLPMMASLAVAGRPPFDKLRERAVGRRDSFGATLPLAERAEARMPVVIG
ncbi:MAG TPA: hypothetical protein PKD84_05570 [Propionicimonas sp.]|nr:hypothetical protein [Propionicimonas sp.]